MKPRSASGFFWTNLLAGRKVGGMRFYGWRWLMTLCGMVLLFQVITTARGEPFPLVTLSNPVPTNVLPPQTPEPAPDQVQPLIEMSDVPISAAIESLARLAGINYIVDYRVISWWAAPDAKSNRTREPSLTFRWKNMTAKDALVRVLKEHHLVLADDSLTSITRITYTNQVVDTGDAGLLGSDTNIIPDIKFQDVPITAGLDSLARLAGFNYLLGPEIGYGTPSKSGRIKTGPILDLRWKGVTAKQAFIAVCEECDLIIFKNRASGVIIIRAKDHAIKQSVEGGLLGRDTNQPVTIQMQAVRLDQALEQLAKQAGIEITLGSILSEQRDLPDMPSYPGPLISIRWNNLTPKQAIIALCENYNLVIVKDAATGIVSIKPGD